MGAVAGGLHELACSRDVTGVAGHLTHVGHAEKAVKLNRLARLNPTGDHLDAGAGLPSTQPPLIVKTHRSTTK